MIVKKKIKPRIKLNEVRIRPTKGIRLEDLDVRDRVSYTHPTAGSRHIAEVTAIDKKGNIHLEDWVKDKLIIKIDNVREIWKLTAGEWVVQPLYEEDK